MHCGGNPKVASEQSLTVAVAPDPLPDADAAVVKIGYRFGDGWKFLRVVTERAELRKLPGEPKAFAVCR